MKPVLKGQDSIFPQVIDITVAQLIQLGDLRAQLDFLWKDKDDVNCNKFYKL